VTADIASPEDICEICEHALKHRGVRDAGRINQNADLHVKRSDTPRLLLIAAPHVLLLLKPAFQLVPNDLVF
jgi:hypothetical protein